MNTSACGYDNACVENGGVFDYVIVGAGTAGAPLAKLLSDDFGVSVFIVEGGPDLRRDPAVLRSINPVAENIPSYKFTADIARALPNPITGASTEFSEGRLWGGSSGHNFLQAVRGTPCLYDRWACISGNDNWCYENALSAMVYLEHYTSVCDGVNTLERGTSGPLFITQLGPPVVPACVNPDSPLSWALAANGSLYSGDYNDPTRGVFVFGEIQQFVRPEPPFNRSWAASAFLGFDVVDENGEGVDGRQLTIESNAEAIRVLFDDDLDERTFMNVAGLPRARHRKNVRHHRGHHPGEQFTRASKPGCEVRGNAPVTARGVRYHDASGNTVDVFARKKVILSAGTVGTPVILARSGIGPREELERLGVPIRVVNDNVGTNLQNHYGPATVIPASPGSEVFITAFFAGQCSTNEGCREIQLIMLPGEIAPGVPAVTILAANLVPEPSGVIRPSCSLNPRDIVIDFNFYEEAKDIALTVRILKLIGNISIESSGRLPFFPPPETYPASEYAQHGGQASSDQALIEFALANTIVFNHNSGSARMSRTAECGVVDGNLDVHCVEHLGIADNSVVPIINDGNTAYTAYVVGLLKAKIEGAPVPF